MKTAAMGIAPAVSELTGIVGSPDGTVLLKETLRGQDPERLGQEAAKALKSSKEPTAYWLKLGDDRFAEGKSKGKVYLVGRVPVILS